MVGQDQGGWESCLGQDNAMSLHSFSPYEKKKYQRTSSNFLRVRDNVYDDACARKKHGKSKKNYKKNYFLASIWFFLLEIQFREIDKNRLPLKKTKIDIFRKINIAHLMHCFLILFLGHDGKYDVKSHSSLARIRRSTEIWFLKYTVVSFLKKLKPFAICFAWEIVTENEP